MVDKQPIFAANDINLDIDRNDFVTILGHSGSGKTTLLSLIGGLAAPDSGKVLIDGKDVRNGNDKKISQMRNETIGFIFQFASLIPTLTAFENLLLPLSFSGRKEDGLKKAAQLLHEVGLSEKRNCFPAELSGGQQRRVAIARAFMNDPQIILADEPTGDLDEETEFEIMKLFYERHQQGTTFVIVTHNSQLAQGHDALRVLQMKNGSLQEQ